MCSCLEMTVKTRQRLAQDCLLLLSEEQIYSDSIPLQKQLLAAECRKEEAHCDVRSPQQQPYQAIPGPLVVGCSNLP